MKFKNYYKILGVKRTASSADIKKRFKDLAQIYHPDKNSSEKAMIIFKEIMEAYNVLGNLDKRLEYSQYLHGNKLNQQIIAMKDYEIRKERKI
jgi:curved DNA-binding protein